MALVNTFNIKLCSSPDGKNMTHCTQKVSKINWLTIKNNQFRGFIEIRPLEACKTYLVELTPVKSLKNRMISSPGENLTTIQSTLCMAGSKGHHNIGQYVFRFNLHTIPY